MGGGMGPFFQSTASNELCNTGSFGAAWGVTSVEAGGARFCNEADMEVNRVYTIDRTH